MGGFCPTLDVYTFFNKKAKVTKMVTFPNIYLETIWYSKSLSIKVDITMATTFWQAGFTIFGISLFLI